MFNKQLHSKRNSLETKVTPVLSQSEEDKLWETGVINLDNLVELLRAGFILKQQEALKHCNLTILQLQ